MSLKMSPIIIVKSDLLGSESETQIDNMLAKSKNIYYQKYTKSLKSTKPEQVKPQSGTIATPIEQVADIVMEDEVLTEEDSTNLVKKMNMYYRKYAKHYNMKPLKTQIAPLLPKYRENGIYLNRSVKNRDIGGEVVSENNTFKLHTLLLQNPDSIYTENVFTNSINPLPYHDSLTIGDVVINVTDSTITAKNVTVDNIQSSTGGDITIGGLVIPPAGGGGGFEIKMDNIIEVTPGHGITIVSNDANAVNFTNGITTFYGSDKTSQTKQHTNAGEIPEGVGLFNVCSITLGTNSSFYVELQITAITNAGSVELYKSIKVLKRDVGDISVINSIDLQRHDNWSYLVSGDTCSFRSQEISGIIKKYNATILVQQLTDTSSYSLVFV